MKLFGLSIRSPFTPSVEALRYRSRRKSIQAADGASGASIIGSRTTAFVGPYGLHDKFQPEQAVERFASWAWISASRNATALAQGSLHLYSKRGTGEPFPKHVPYRRVKSVRQYESDDVIEILEHPFLELMKKVNPNRNAFDFIEETSMFLDCHGNSYWYVGRGEGVLTGIPTELWVLPSQYITIVPDDKNFIKGYLYGIYGKKVALTPEQVIHLRRPSVRDLFYGMSRVEAAWMSIISSHADDQFEYQFSSKQGVKDKLVAYEGTLDPDQRRELQIEWDWLLSNGNSRVLITDNSAKVTDIQQSPREAIALSAREWHREEIINAFGQNMALYSKDANRANIEGAIYLWARFELDPSLCRIAQKINEQLLPMYDAGGRMWCEYERLALRDSDFDLRQETVDISGKVRTINEVRKTRGLEPLAFPEADNPFINSAPPLAGDAFGNAPTTPLEGEKIHRSLKRVALHAYP